MIPPVVNPHFAQRVCSIVSLLVATETHNRGQSDPRLCNLHSIQQMLRDTAEWSENFKTWHILVISRIPIFPLSKVSIALLQNLARVRAREQHMQLSRKLLSHTTCRFQRPVIPANLHVKRSNSVNYEVNFPLVQPLAE